MGVKSAVEVTLLGKGSGQNFSAVTTITMTTVLSPCPHICGFCVGVTLSP